MAGRSSIEWTEMTWNPVTGCSKVSAGCRNCYAERMAKRLQAIGLPQYSQGFQLTLAPHVLEAPLSWKVPKMVFVNSMSDLFHEDVPPTYIQSIFSVMRRTPQHTYQVLTKRSARLAALSPYIDWPSNVWMGVSVENQHVKIRISHLKATSARVKFLSLEPLIGALGDLDLYGIDWVIVGGESGPRARPIKRTWIEEVRRQCVAAGVPFFFKQWGRPAFNDNPLDPTIARSHPRHAKGGCELDGQLHRAFPPAMLVSGT